MNLRIGNIEIRKYKSPPNKKIFYEIIKWNKNEFYGKLQEYILKGYVESFTGESLQKDGHSIDLNFFYKNPEVCHVIAFITLDYDNRQTVLNSVGERILNLTDEDQIDFLSVYNQGNKKIRKKHKF